MASYPAVTALSDREAAPEIIEGCRAGDRDALRALYDVYKDRVYSLSFYFFHGDESIANDVTQQVFLKLITCIHQFKGDAAFSTWLYRLVVNACRDTARRRKWSGVNKDNVRVEGIAREGSKENDLVRAQTARYVREAVCSLPPKFRIAILLRYFDDLSYEQISQALHCSMGTVASRLSRGHKMLAQHLKNVTERSS